LLVEGCPEAAPQDDSDPRRVLEILLRQLPLKQAVGLAAEITRTKKNLLYEKALELKKENSEE
jgi:16S rRNA (cytidine1402-2'-O)-methyltransferase